MTKFLSAGLLAVAAASVGLGLAAKADEKEKAKASQLDMLKALAGERLILVTQQKDSTRADFQAFAKANHASDLMIPSEVWVIDKVPLLGSGKVDMVALAKLVHERLLATHDAPARAIG